MKLLRNHRPLLGRGTTVPFYDIHRWLRESQATGEKTESAAEETPEGSDDAGATAGDSIKSEEAAGEEQ